MARQASLEPQQHLPGPRSCSIRCSSIILLTGSEPSCEPGSPIPLTACSHAGVLSIPNNPNNFEVMADVDHTLNPPTAFGAWTTTLLEDLWAATVRGLLPLSFFFEPMDISSRFVRKSDKTYVDQSANTPMHVILGPAYTVHLAEALRKHLESQLQLVAPCMQSSTGEGGIGATDAAVRYADTRAVLWSEIDNVRHMCATGEGVPGVSTAFGGKGGLVKGVLCTAALFHCRALFSLIWWFWCCK